MKLLMLFNIFFITIFSILKCQTNNSIINEGNEEFIDVSKANINPYKDKIEKELFPPYIRCETLGTVSDMFFYNTTFMNCAPTQWTCIYDDLILLANKTMAHCYNRRNFGVACLYGGFRPMSRCRNDNKKCGINYFNCKEKKPRNIVEYSDNFLFKLGEAVKSKNISIEENLLEKIKEADNRRISNNITDIEDYQENTIIVDDNFLLENDEIFDYNVTEEKLFTQIVSSTEDVIATTTYTLLSSTSTLSNSVFDKIKDNNITYNEFNNTYNEFSKTLTLKNNSSDDVIQNNIISDKKNYTETIKEINLEKNNGVQQNKINTSTQNYQIFMDINNFLNNPIKNTTILFLCIIIIIIFIFICCKMCGKATYVYEVAEHQRLMDINVNSTTFKNETFNPSYHNRRKN
ncbi:Hypothetical protein SRAE_X000205200 [Strongyloides ratti]|uniref:Uncharacterized protein n=1 Tax=Strongyloides ratti TaxID=34506 RepID=A0A090KYM8_STRRB|nr:Hypothetical protein SRAE_X000205200 [Strongyloides ratti]CEF60314.1 Hypothetical protein SRAE_X000205200 [Strongyloides ratti]